MKSELLKKLRLCPFCQSDHADGWTWFSDEPNCNNQYHLIHYCRREPKKYDRVISVYGATPEECVERWNADGKEHTPE